MASFQPHLPTSTYSPHLVPHSWAHTSNRTLGICFSNKFIPKSELPHLGQVIYHQQFPPLPRKNGKKGVFMCWKRRRVGHTCLSEALSFPLPVLMALSRFCLQVCPAVCDRLGSDAMPIRGTKPQLYICFSSFALRRLSFDVLLLRRLDGGNNGNSKKCQLDYCLRVGTSPGSFKGMFYWFCNCTLEWTNWTVPQGKESPCLNGICWMYALL